MDMRIEGSGDFKKLQKTEGHQPAPSTPIEEQMKKDSSSLLNQQKKSVRKGIARMLADAQKGRNNSETHVQKVTQMIEHHQGQLTQHLHAYPEKEKQAFVQKEVGKQKEMLSSAHKTASTPSSSPETLQSLLSKLKSDSNPRDSLNFIIKLMGIIIPYESSKQPTINTFLQTLYTQMKTVYNSSPTAGIQTFWDTYHYQGYVGTGTKSALKDLIMLCPALYQQNVPGGLLPNTTWSEFLAGTVFQNPPSVDPVKVTNTPQAIALMNAELSLQKIEDGNPLASWVIQEIQQDTNITNQMSLAQVGSYLVSNFNIYEQFPLITKAQVDAVFKILDTTPPTPASIETLMSNLNTLKFPKDTAAANLVSEIINAYNNKVFTTIQELGEWVQKTFFTASQDLWIQFPGVQLADLQSIFKTLKLSEQIPTPTQMDQIFTSAYQAYQTTKSNLYKDLYTEVASLGSADTNLPSLQSWAESEFSSSDFTSASATIEQNFCSLVGTINITAMTGILNNWTSSQTPSLAALAKYLLSCSFSSLSAMQAAVTGETGVEDIFMLVPSLVTSGNASTDLSTLFSALYIGQTAPKVPSPTAVDNAYANAFEQASQSGVPQKDLALYQLMENQCKTQGSQWPASALEGWAGWEALNSTFTSASNTAQLNFLSYAGIPSLSSAPLYGSQYYLQQLLSTLSTSSQTYTFLDKTVLPELSSLISSNGSWSTFTSWASTEMATNDIYMLCPDATTSEIESIYQYLQGPTASLPAETPADTNYIEVLNKMNATGISTADKALISALATEMYTLGSNVQNQAQSLQTAFESSSSLPSIFTAADEQTQIFFMSYTGEWAPSYPYPLETLLHDLYGLSFPNDPGAETFIKLITQQADNSDITTTAELVSAIEENILNGNADVWIQAPGIQSQDLDTILNKLSIPLTQVPAVTNMDTLFLEAYNANTASPGNPIYSDLYQEIQTLGSADENFSALQQWGLTMLSSSDFANSSTQAQENFCSWTGNMTFSSIQSIMQGWEQSGTAEQQALAEFFLGQGFSTLEQAQNFFSPNSPSYGFGKLDIYAQIPAILQATNPTQTVQNFLSLLFTGSISVPQAAQPTAVDTAYATISSAASSASGNDLLLYQQFIQEVQTNGSNWLGMANWGGFEVISSYYQNASSSAQQLFASALGIANPTTAPMISASNYLTEIMSDVQGNLATYAFLQSAIQELQTLISGGNSWSDFQTWVQTQFKTNDIYMVCPDATSTQIQQIYFYLTGNASPPSETSADSNYIQVYTEANLLGVYGGNLPLYDLLLSAMRAIGSSTDDQATALQNYFENTPGAMTALQEDWSQADTDGQSFFEQFTGGWAPPS